MNFRNCRVAGLAILFALLAPVLYAQTPPRSWVDKDTGHRVIRLTDEAGSGAPYFNINAFSPDGKLMEYTAPDGIHVLDLATRKTRLLVPNPPANAAPTAENRFGSGLRFIVVGHKTPSVFFTKYDRGSKVNALYKANMYTGAVTKLVDLPAGYNVITINADETLGAGTHEVNSADAAKEYGRNHAPGYRAPSTANGGKPQAARLLQPLDKGQMMARRLAARIPLVLFTIDLRPGPTNGKKTILLHSTDWLNHLLFSPADPHLLMYCHEGAWQKVDRIWTIHTDGTHNMLMHKRTMAMEIAGHEFWGPDGKTIWYDWQYPKGEDFFLAGYDLATGRRTAYHMTRNDWSIHFNATADRSFFVGDGGDPGQVAHAPDGEWIELFHPHMIPTNGAMNSPTFWQPGVFQAEHLVNMSHHNYRLEPNVHISPDRKLVIFTSNMFGPSYVFGVEIAKAVNAQPSEIHSTPDLARQFNPVNPPPTHAPSPADQRGRY